MDEIIPGLWIGGLPSAQNTQLLKEQNIYSILSAMRGRITINEVGSMYGSPGSLSHILQTFIRHQIMLDDTDDADVLVHLLPSIHFVQAELDKGRGVLVHCQAGVSEHPLTVTPGLI
jgi:dual specificity phosphatase 12